MKTTELFVDQVLIGSLVVAVFWALSPVDISAWQDVDIMGGTALVVTAYFAGMLYDRFSDTLLQDLERHHYLAYGLQRHLGKGRLLPGNDAEEIFEIGKYRMMVIRCPEASDYSDYLRSRIRLTRVLSTLLPAITVALVAYLLKNNGANLTLYDPDTLTGAWVSDLMRWWLCGAVAVAYGISFLSQFLKGYMPNNSDEPQSTRRRFLRPPRTKLNDKQLSGYKAMVGGACNENANIGAHIGAMFKIEPILCPIALLLMGLAGALAIIYQQEGLAVIAVAGLMFTLLTGWIWWRITQTFLTFIVDFSGEDEEAKASASPA